MEKQNTYAPIESNMQLNTNSNSKKPGIQEELEKMAGAVAPGKKFIENKTRLMMDSVWNMMKNQNKFCSRCQGLKHSKNNCPRRCKWRLWDHFATNCPNEFAALIEEILKESTPVVS